MKQFTIQVAGERIQISAKAELKGFAQPVESLPSRASESNDKLVRLEGWNYSISGANSEASKIIPIFSVGCRNSETLNMSVKATKKRLNLNSRGNDDMMLDAQSSESLSYGL
jgi:hypothetical protein